MSAILSFCTAKVPAQVWVTIQRRREWNTEPTVQDFDTGFDNTSDAELRSLIELLIQRSTAGASTRLAGDWIAVLDDKFKAQSTVVLHYSYAEDLWDEPIPALAELVNGTIWFKWRVQFKATWTLFNAVSSCGELGIELFSRDEYQDSDGVLQAETPTMIINGGINDPKDN